MDTQTSTQMTIKQAAEHYQVSDKTVRRWIKQKRIKGKRIDGRWYVYPDLDNDLDTGQPNVQPDDPPDEQPARAVSTAHVEQMQSEIEHLREALHRRDTQIEQQNKLMAMLTQQNDRLLIQLPLNRGASVMERVSQWGARLYGSIWSSSRSVSDSAKD